MPKKLEDLFQQEVQRRKQQKKPGGGNFGTPLLVTALAILAGYVINQVRSRPTVISQSEPTATQTEPPKPAKPKPPAPKPVPLPLSSIQKDGSQPGEPVSQLRFFVRAPLSSENSKMSASCGEGAGAPLVKNINNYYVELLDWQSGRIVSTAFVRSGEMVEIPVPFGSYKLRYAEGTEWYGNKALFGSSDMYEMTEKYAGTAARLEFNETGGHDIGFQCASGNLGRKRVTKGPLEDLPAKQETGT